MQLLQRGVDRTVIALWLGHESIETTQIYLPVGSHVVSESNAQIQPPLSDGKLVAESENLSLIRV